MSETGHDTSAGPADEGQQTTTADSLANNEAAQDLRGTGVNHAHDNVGPDIEGDTSTADEPGISAVQTAVNGSMSADAAGPSVDAASTSGGARAAYEQVLVTKVDQGSGPNMYTISSMGPDGRRYQTQRRFDDLVTLHESLKCMYRGCVIPFRPGKTVTNSTLVRSHSETFLKQRAYAIQQYLDKVVRHPDLSQSEVLKQFMESNEVLRNSLDWARHQPKRQSVIGGLVASMRKIAGTEQRIPTPSQIEMGNGKSEHDLVRQMAEMKVNRKKLHANASDIEKRLHNLEATVVETSAANQQLSQGAQHLVDAARALHDAHIDLGSAFEIVRKSEDEAEAKATFSWRMTQEAKNAVVALLVALTKCVNKHLTADQTRLMAIMEPVSDHALMLPRVEKAMAARLDSLVVLESLRRQQSIINATYQELRAKESSGSMSNNDVRRMNRVRGEQDQMQQAIEAAERVYRRMCDRNERDISLYMSERSEAFKDMVARVAEARAAHADALAAAWSNMAAQLGCDLSAYGADLELLNLADLGFQPSASAHIPDEYIDDTSSTNMLGAPAAALPDQHGAEPL